MFSPEQLASIGIDAVLKDHYRRAFLDEHGRPNMVLIDFAKRFFLFRPTSRKGDTVKDADINEGQRRALTHIIGVLDLTPEEVLSLALK